MRRVMPHPYAISADVHASVMQRALYLILTLCFSLYVLSGPVLWATYYMFADRIAAAYCVNPDNPSCHGRCHINKVNQEEKDNRAPASVISPEKLPPFLVILTGKLPMISEDVSFHGVSVPHYADGFPQDIDHPPLSFA